MANQWLRLWHDMPNDPKWRVISKKSQQPLSLVQALYIHILIDASTNATERGRTQSNYELFAMALDVEIDQIEKIFDAMQGRVLDGNFVSGWEIRQPKREDNSSERSRAWREDQKLRNAHRTQTNANEREQTQSNANDPKNKSIHKNEYLDKDIKDNVDSQSNKKQTKKYYEQDSFEVWVATQICQMVLDIHPSDRHVSNAMKDNYQTWAHEISVLINSQGRTPDEIRKVIEWLNGPSNEARWWRGKNIRSTAKFCIKYDDLVLQMNSSRNFPSNTQKLTQFESKMQRAMEWAKKKDGGNFNVSN